MDERQTKVSIIEFGIGIGSLGERNSEASPAERLIDIHLRLGWVEECRQQKVRRDEWEDMDKR